MRALSSASVLDLWEKGLSLHPLDRSLLALGATVSGTPRESPADWPLGRRNRALAELHSFWFRPNLQAWVACPQCGEKLEFELDGPSLLAREEPSSMEPVTVNGLAFRLPTSRDLARVAGETDARRAAVRLLESCLEGNEPPEWSEEDLERIGQKLALADPMAETRIGLQCSECRHEWNENLDISEFLWAEIEARAKHLLWEIHSLAAVYGWSEAEILSLSEMRRSRYLEMVNQ
ncbi:MAG TPA: hypothetical protein VH639_08760 [Bryobacteraceae bacterium]|jgi:hypothetical protein